MTAVIDEELRSLNASLSKLEGVELVTCVRAHVRVHIKRTEHKQMAACFQFPQEYPDRPILTELKSKVLADKLLAGLTKATDEEAQKHVGKTMILQLVTFLKRFLDENPLCVCSEEISQIKKRLARPTDEIKLKQKNSQIVLRLKEQEYHVTARLNIPEDYPDKSVEIEIGNQNFPNNLMINYKTQASEIARRCIEPPLRRRPKDPPFVPRPSVLPVAEYLVGDILRRYPHETCPICSEPSLPKNAENVTNTIADKHFVFRVYCAHLFHHECLETYMKSPPFTGGKKCPRCKLRIFHESFKMPPELAEARWAHKEARNRELAEVEDFFH